MKNNNETKVSVLNPLLIAMSVCFAVLKLADIITMSWWLVATPLIIMVGIWLLIIIGMLLAVPCVNLIDNFRWRWRSPVSLLIHSQLQLAVPVWPLPRESTW